MAAITDQDELSYIQSQLNDGAPPPVAPAGMVVAPLNSAPITDADELAHIRSQLESPQVPASPAPSSAVTVAPYNGPVIEARPEKSWGEIAGDVGRMLTNKIPFADRVAAVGDTLIPGSGPGKSKDYAGNLRDERMKDESIAHDYPILSKVLGYGGAAAGALATAPEAAIAAPTMLSRVGAGAATGAAYGGIQGASDTPDLTKTEDAAKNIAAGAGFGILTGAAMPITAAGLGTAYAGTANALNGGVDGISRRAAGQLLPALAADTPAAIHAELDRLGPQGMLADTGPAMRGKAQGASLNSDEGRNILQSRLTDRDVGTIGRVNADVNAVLGPAASPQQITNAIQRARSYEHRALPRIFQNAGPVDISEVLTAIGQGLNTARGPEAAVLSRARDYLMRDAVDAQGQPIRVPVTNAQTLQNAKLAIDMLIDRGDPGLGVPAGAVSRAQGVIGYVRGRLNGALRDQVLGYSDVMDNSSALARRADAIEQGYKDVLGGGKSALHPADLEAQLRAAAQGGMGPNSPVIDTLQGLRIGTRSAIDNSLGTKANDLLALRNDLQAGAGQEQAAPSWNQQKLEAIFGENPARELNNTVDRNLTFRDTYRDVVKGSQTAQRQAASDAMKPEAATGGIPYINPNMTLAGAIATPVKAAGAAILRSLRSDPTRAYGEIADVLSAQGSRRDAYMSALVDALMRRNTNAATGMALGNRAAMAGALIGGPAANDQLLGR